MNDFFRRLIIGVKRGTLEFEELEILAEHVTWSDTKVHYRIELFFQKCLISRLHVENCTLPENHSYSEVKVFEIYDNFQYATIPGYKNAIGFLNDALGHMGVGTAYEVPNHTGYLVQTDDRLYRCLDDYLLITRTGNGRYKTEQIRSQEKIGCAL
jgi:hypothetical protein